MSTSTLRPSRTAADDVRGDLAGTGLVGDESARNTSWIAAISPFPAVQLGLVNVEPPGECGGRRFGESDLVTDGAALHGDDRFEPITPVRGCGQPDAIDGSRASGSASSNDRAGR